MSHFIPTTEDLNLPLIQSTLNALESGSYQQGVGALHPSPGTYCCLGIMCEVSQRGHWEKCLREVDRLKYIMPEDQPENSELPHTIAEDMGFWEKNGNVPYLVARDAIAKSERREICLEILDKIHTKHTDGGEMVALSELNDAGLSFPSIALILREYYSQTFNLHFD